MVEKFKIQASTSAIVKNTTIAIFQLVALFQMGARDVKENFPNIDCVDFWAAV